jgi:TonB-linked SusC/RagA family outer membrane protein
MYRRPLSPVAAVVGQLVSWLLVLAFGPAPVRAQSNLPPLQIADSRPSFYMVSSASGKREDARREAVLWRRVSLDLTNVPIAAALQEIGRQSGLHFVYTEQLLPLTNRVSVKAADITVAAALTEVLLGADVDVQLSPSGQAAIVPQRKPPRSLAGTISGTVTDAGTHEPLAAVNIQLEGTRLGALTNENGAYHIAGVPPGNYTISARRLGYARVSRTVTVTESSNTTADFALEKSATSLDEIVVTGTPQQQTKRALGNALGKVNAAEITQVAPPPNVQQLLNNVPGVRVQSAGGDVGSGGNTRIRGASSMTLASEPLVYIDGVRVNNAAADAGGFPGVGVDSRYPPSRINDINPDEIESIEIIKGPAAATLYGTEASNGVINILTKRGNKGKPSISFQVKGGANWLPNPEELFQHSYYKNQAGEIVDADVLGHDRTVGFPVSYYGYCPKPYKQSGDMCKGSPFSTGNPQAYEGSISGGTDALNYYFFGGWDRDEGAVDYNWKNRLNGRANLSYTPTEKISLDFGLGYERSKLRSAGAQQPVTTAILWSCPSPGCEPGLGLPGGLDAPLRGYLSYVPEVYEDNIQGYEDLDRSTVTATLKHHPMSWFTHRLTVGGDFTSQQLSDLWKKISTVGSLYPAGRRDVETTQISYFSADYAATASVHPFQSLGLETSVGFQYYRKQVEAVYGHAETFPVSDLETISSGALKTAQENFLENKTVGLYGQEQFAWKDRLYLTAALRGDDNSAFGKSYKAAYYPKFSVAWVVSDEPFFQRMPLISSFKLRSAWGEAGQQPDAFAALRTYVPETGAGGTPTLTPQNLGNSSLKPEVGQELEVGADVSLFSNRLALEFTWYSKKTKDALVQVPALPSLGFPGVQYQNVGEVDNRGVEIGVSGDVFHTANTGLNLGFKFSHNKNEVVSLGGTSSLVMNATYGQYHVPGFPLGSIFQRRVLSADIDNSGATPKAINMMCESGTVIPGTNFSRGGGGPVPCADAPAVYWGNPLPSWEGSGTATLTLFKNLQLFGLVDFLGGNTILSGDIRASLMSFRNQRAILEAKDPILLAYDILDTRRQPGIVKGGFAKLREISATFNLPPAWLKGRGASRASVTLSAQNLWTIWVQQRSDFGVKLTDPEIRNSAGSGSDPGGLLGYNQEGWPQLRRVLLTLRVTL